MSQWFFARNGQQRGPYSAATIRKAVQEGKLTAQDLVWNDTMTEWLPVGQVSEFAGAIAASPRPSAAAVSTKPRTAAAPVRNPVAETAAEYDDQPPSTQAEPALPSPPDVVTSQPAAVPYQSAGGRTIVFTPIAMKMLAQTKPWVRFVGILCLIVSAIAAVIGAVIAVAPFTGPSKPSTVVGPRGMTMVVEAPSTTSILTALLIPLLMIFGSAAIYFLWACT